MSAECYPITIFPHVSKLYRDYLAMADSPAEAPVRRWYGAEPFGKGWMGTPVAVKQPERLADALKKQNEDYGAGSAALENIDGGNVAAA